jgi:nucleoside-diphosphate-sugar epimerase
VRALVTGAGGFVGAHLAARLVADGWDVVGTIRPGGSADRLVALGVHASVELRVVDLSAPGPAAELAGGSACDVAFLLAAARACHTSAERAATAAVNGPGGRWLVDALPRRCRAVVRLGSSTEYGPSDGLMGESTPVRPQGFFGATKARGSRLVVEAAGERQLRSVILRAFQVYGSLDHPGRLVPAAFRAARTGEVLPLTAPGRRRDWVHVDDVVEACARAAAADHLPGGQVLNIGTGRQVANEELVEAVGATAGRPVRVDVGGHPGRAWDRGSWGCDPSLAARLLGWTAVVSLADGLGRCRDAEPDGDSGGCRPEVAA